MIHTYGTHEVLLGMVTTATGGLALLACLTRALRATRVNPVEALSES